MNKNDKVGLILVNYKQYELTKECLGSIFCSDYPDFEVVLVDNCSNESAASNIEKTFADLNLTVLKFDQNIGYTRGVNKGLSQLYSNSRPDFIMILNNDTILDKSAISEFVNSLKRNNKKAIVTGKVYYFDERDKIQTAGELFKYKNNRISIVVGEGEYDHGQHDIEAERDMIDDIFWMFPIELYETIGGYDETFFIYGEQADYAMRAKQNGFKLIYTPKAVIWHKESQSTGGTEHNNINPIKVYWRIKNRLIYYYKYSSKFSFFTYCIEYFAWVNTKIIHNLILFLFNKKKTYKNNFAEMRGLFAFVKWLFDKNTDGSYNPYLINRK